MRPIDADVYANHLETALKESIIEAGIKGVQEFLAAAAVTAAVVSDLRDENITPTIDVVKVVRCENCKWRNKAGRCTYIAQIYPFVAKDHFCKYGEPKDGSKSDIDNN